MMAAEQPDDRREDPPCLRTALAMLSQGVRPIPLHPGKKNPIGEGWGLRQHTEASLRSLFRSFPGAGIGILLGDDGTGNGIIDFDIDDPELAVGPMNRMFPDGVPDTLRFQATKGMHYTFLYDRRLAKYGETIIKGELEEDGRVKGNPHYLGLEIRIGTIDPSHPVQEQTIIPPTPRTDGTARQWISPGGTLLLPEVALGDLDRILPIPESVFADLDLYAHDAEPEPEAESEEQVGPRLHSASSTAARVPGLQWDKEEVKAAILPRALDLAREWGLEITGKRATSKGFWECRAIDRKDNDPSAGFNEKTGVYTDRKYDQGLSIFQLAVALRAYQDFHTAVNELGKRFRVSPTRARRSFDGSDSFEPVTLRNKDRPWRVPRLYEPIPACPFPLDVLPHSLAELCREGAKAFQCPPDYFAVSALALAGSSVGLSVNLMVKPHYPESPNLYMAIVGPPGTKKSPALKTLALALYAIDRELREEYERDVLRYEEERQEYEADKRKGIAGAPPVAPIPAQLTIDDSTREALTQVHAENPRGLAVIMDELSSLVATLNAYRNGKGDDKQFWMRCNSGMLVKVNRKSSRVPLLIPRPCLTLVGGLTPDNLPAIRESRRDDGWLDRILFSYPDPIEPADWTEEVLPDPLLDDWTSAVRRLWQRKMVVGEDGRLRPFFVNFSDQSRPLWTEWINAHRREQRSLDFPRSLRGPWSKLEGFVARLALILSQLHQAYDPTHDGPPRDVSPLELWGARKLGDYFKAHFRRARYELTRRHESLTEDAEAVVKWLQHTERSQFSERDLKVNFRGRFADHPADVADALACLVGLDLIRPVEITQITGRPHSETYIANPNLVSARAQNSQNHQNSDEDEPANANMGNLGDKGEF